MDLLANGGGVMRKGEQYAWTASKAVQDAFNAHSSQQDNCCERAIVFVCLNSMAGASSKGS
jgi:hypothetical protein